MKETYNTIDYTSVQDTAVASLMLHVGVSVSSQYAYSGTGAGSRDVPEALATYFGYDKQTMTELERQNFEWDDWNSILQKELVLRRPIFYSGYRGNNFAGGHAFVCDGIDNDGYYHINWGWSGSCNGYFDITILNSEKDKSHAGEYMQAGFCKDNCIIVGIQPADGQEHEPPFAFDRLGILLSSACFEKSIERAKLKRLVEL